MAEEGVLPGLEELPNESKEIEGSSAKERQPRFEYVNRQQLLMRMLDVEQLIEAEHPARAIWEFLGRINLSSFSEGVQAYEGERGRAAHDPRLLVSLWVYAYSQGVTAGREIARLCESDPAYQWLTGMKVVNYHSLTDFRVQHETALRELFIQILGVLSSEGLVSLERVMNDGTKIKAQGSRHSFRGQKKIKEHLAAARKHVEALEQQAEAEVGQRLSSARERAAREKVARLETALAEFEKLQAKPERKEQRVSMSEPESRKMKQSDGGYAPSYNVQLTTDQAQGIIVAAGLSQAPVDVKELVAAVARVKENTGKLPRQVVADGGYTSGFNIKELAEQKIDFIAPYPDNREQLQQRGIDAAYSRAAFTYDATENCYICPTGTKLTYRGQEQIEDRTRFRYGAPKATCAACVFKAQCCPQTQRGRSLTRYEYEAELLSHKAKMQTAEAKEIYKQRGQIAEFPIAWLKEKLGLRRFRVRGKQKAEMEILWACLTHNLQQWIRLNWKPQFLKTQIEVSG